MRLIKLTDADGYTRRGDSGETLWLPCGTRPPRLDGAKLFSAGVYHAYSSPEQAAMMDCIHADLLSRGGRAWWADGEVVVEDGSKVGCHELVLVEPAELPVLMTTAQRVRVAIYCAQELGSHGDAWDRWAERWLSGEDRSASAAVAARAAWAARAAAEAWAAEAWAAEAWAAEAVAARAALSAEAAAEAWAAEAVAARAAEAAAEAWAAEAWAEEAEEAEEAWAALAAEAAAEAALAAEAAEHQVDISEIVRRAIREEVAP